MGNSYEMELDSLGTAGYSWVVEKNDAAITQVSLIPKTPTNKSIGGAGKIILRILPLSPGRSTIQLVQKRIWEINGEPAADYQIQVLVPKK